MHSLRGKRVLITGATAGIGAACARAFAAAGCPLVLTGRREERLRSLAEELSEQFGCELATLAFDIRDREAIGAIHWPEIDILFNNAGLAIGMEPVQAGHPDDWDAMIDTNVKGLLAMTRAILPGMIQRQSGHVINMGSAAGHWAYPGGNIYCATKYAVKALTECLRIDLVGTGVRVSSVDPGMVETDFSITRLRGDEDRARSVYAGMTPLTAEDVAEVVLWCAARPPHVNINTVVMMPVDQAAISLVHRQKDA